MQVYITGHQNPDSDSIIAAISYTYLKNSQNIEAKACRLGSLNPETKYLLDRFGFESPEFLEDARWHLEEIHLNAPHYIYEDETVFDTLLKMRRLQQPYFAVVNEDKKVIGMITRNDLATIAVEDTATGIELLKHAKLEDIRKTINGTYIHQEKDMHINGKVSIVALSKNGAQNYQVEDRIVIVSDDEKAQIQLIEKGAGLLIVVWSEGVSETVIEKAKEYHCPIILSGHGSMNTSRYLYFAIPVSFLMSKNPITFLKEDYLEDAAKIMTKHRYRAYPVLEEGQLYGYVSADHIIASQPRKLILLDHNEFSQSVKNIEKAEVVEVIDHHRINDFSSRMPIYFRNETIGSSCALVASMFFEQGVPLPRKLAGLLLSGMISDTLAFKSPTTTPKDLYLAGELERLSHENIEDLSYDIFSVNDLKKKDLSLAILEDLKPYKISNSKVEIAQIIVPDFEKAKESLETLITKIEDYSKHCRADLYVLALTCIKENGTYFFAGGNLYSQMNTEEISSRDNLYFHENILSRKKQIVPLITDLIYGI